MPTYRKTDRTWTARVRLAGYPQKTKYGFKTKREALAWEAAIKKKHRSMLKTIEAPISDLAELRAKLQDLQSYPNFTLADLFDVVMKELDLPYEFKHVREIAANYIKNKNSGRVQAKLRVEILKRDGYKCRFCGKGPPERKLEVDHIVPRSRGGLSEPRNLHTLCYECNKGKRDVNMMVNVNEEMGIQQD